MAAPRPLTLGALRDWGTAELRGCDTPHLDAELLLAAAAGVARSTVLAFPERAIEPSAEARYRVTIERRARGEPLAYLVGTKEFYSIALRVSPAVLIPRPETELLVEQALARLPAGAQDSVLDLGTGSGAIALAIKRERPTARVTAVDASAAALALAAQNARLLGLAVRWVESNWFAALRDERFELIVCNPPYVRAGDPALAALSFEPRAALDGGADGLHAFRAILAGAAAHLAPRGALLLEHGHEQRAAVVALAAAHGFEPEALHRDYAGLERIAVLRPRARA